MSSAVIDALESRTLFAVTLENGVLNILGTAGNDIVRVYADPRQQSKLDVKVNNKVWQFERDEVHSLFIQTFRGNDIVFVSNPGHPPALPDVSLPTRIYTDAGRDIIWAEGGATRVYAGDGDDQIDAAMNMSRCTLYGGNGNDVIRGGWSHDLIMGNAGKDSLSGNGGNDTIDGGIGGGFFDGGGQPGDKEYGGFDT